MNIKIDSSTKMRILKIVHIGITWAMFFVCWTIFYKKDGTELTEEEYQLAKINWFFEELMVKWWYGKRPKEKE